MSVPFCKDCRWISCTYWCTNPAAAQLRVVTGKVEELAEFVRGTFGKCGPSGKYFEPKAAGTYPHTCQDTTKQPGTCYPCNLKRMEERQP